MTRHSAGRDVGCDPVRQGSRRIARRPVAVRARLVLCAALAAGGLAACSPQVQFHGFAPDDGELAAIEVGRATRADVAAAIGRPSTTAALNDSAWFYVASRWEQRPPRPSVEVAREMVAISFDERGVVTNIERFGLEDGEVVPLSRRVTDTSVRQQGFFRQILRNVGRFQADQFID